MKVYVVGSEAFGERETIDIVRGIYTNKKDAKRKVKENSDYFLFCESELQESYTPPKKEKS